jgi:hypothetical protein
MALPMNRRMHSSALSFQPISSSMSRNTPLVIVSLSTSTPSQSNNTASNFRVMILLLIQELLAPVRQGLEADFMKNHS